jgi:hypothetical protein
MALTKINNNTLSAITGLPAGIGGKVLQVVTAVLSGGSSNKETTSSSFVSGTLAVAITPSATSSKILVKTANGFGSSGDAYFTIYRGSTNLGGSTYGMQRINATTYSNGSLIHLDAPSSTSSLTYTVYFRAGSGTAYINNTQYAQIIAMEVGG